MSQLHNMQPSGFNQTPILAIEKDFDEIAGLEWIERNWTLSLWCSVIYVIVIFGGKYFMDNRPPFELRRILAVWSATNAAFSILGTARVLPELLYVIDKYGWEYSVCNSSYFLGSTKCWGYLYTVSKIFELGDTLFIVLRKQKLVFLHWYHHVTVMVYTWYSYSGWQSMGRWFMAMNFAVHSFMYTYYTFKAMRFRVPKFISIIITVLQLLQVSYHIKYLQLHGQII